jgi:hypothetical protein
MTLSRAIGWTVAVAFVLALAGTAYLVVPAWFGTNGAPPPAASVPPPPSTPKIKARLFYVSDDGLRLVSVEREIPFGQGTLAQAKEIVEAQIAPPDPALVSAIPAGTRLRAIFVDAQGQAFVDLSPEVSSAHPGGTLEESLTVYSIVDAITANLPAVKAVQILVNGREVDTLAGHVDLRRPLPADPSWTQEPAPAEPPAGTASSPSDQPAPAAPREAAPIK